MHSISTNLFDRLLILSEKIKIKFTTFNVEFKNRKILRGIALLIMQILTSYNVCHSVMGMAGSAAAVSTFVQYSNFHFCF